jgi:hypothetical protein
MPQPDNAAGTVEHPKEILGVSLVPHDQPPEILEPRQTTSQFSSVADSGAGLVSLVMYFFDCYGGER